MAKRGFPFKVVDRKVSAWGRYMTVEFDDGRRFQMGVERGKRVRIAYKPRGKNIGFRWNGFVRSEDNSVRWSGEVCKGLGVPGLLRCAGIIPGEWEVRKGDVVVEPADRRESAIYARNRLARMNPEEADAYAVWHRGERIND